MTQRDLAAAANISHGYVHQIEASDLKDRPSDQVMRSLARALGVPPAELYASHGLPIEPPADTEIMLSGYLGLDEEKKEEVDKLIERLLREQAWEAEQERKAREREGKGSES